MFQQHLMLKLLQNLVRKLKLPLLLKEDSKIVPNIKEHKAKINIFNGNMENIWVNSTIM